MQPNHPSLQAILIATGNELMTGDLLDSNSAWLAQQLTRCQVRVRSMATIGDSFDDLTESLKQAIGQAQLVILTGGLGPTPDDLTRSVLARVSNQPLQRDPALLREIERFFHRLGRPMKPVNQVQADIPQGAKGLSNPVGTAPGIQMELGACTVFALPGVPREMKGMFEQHVLPWVDRHTPPAIHRVNVLCCGGGESDIVDRLSDILQKIQEHPEVSFGTRASDSIIALKLTGPDQGELEIFAQMIEARLGQMVFGRNETTLAETVASLLAQSQETLAVGESCTAGGVGEEITTVPGSSGFFLGGWITYSNEFKNRFLGVPREILDTEGAVSEACVHAMTRGVLEQSGADWAIAVSGIAGPGGGTEEKPVGLVYFGIGRKDEIRIYKRTFTNLGREAIRHRATLTALNYLRLQLLEKATQPGG